MLTIHKYEFKVDDRLQLKLPRGKILKVELQNGTPCIWMICDTDDTLVNRSFRIYGTGRQLDMLAGVEIPIKDWDRQHVATFQQGQFVWHMFEFV